MAEMLMAIIAMSMATSSMVDATVSRITGKEPDTKSGALWISDFRLGLLLFCLCLSSFSAASAFYNFEMSAMACLIFVVVWGLVGWGKMGFKNPLSEAKSPQANFSQDKVSPQNPIGGPIGTIP